MAARLRLRRRRRHGTGRHPAVPARHTGAPPPSAPPPLFQLGASHTHHFTPCPALPGPAPANPIRSVGIHPPLPIPPEAITRGSVAIKASRVARRSAFSLGRVLPRAESGPPPFPLGHSAGAAGGAQGRWLPPLARVTTAKFMTSAARSLCTARSLTLLAPRSPWRCLALLGASDRLTKARLAAWHAAWHAAGADLMQRHLWTAPPTPHRRMAL